MTWADFYLICFIVGLSFSILSFLFSGFHWHLHLHLHIPHWMDLPHHGIGSNHAAASPNEIPFLNLPTIMTFLAWFGGVGFLVTHAFSLWFLATLLIAVAAGLAGAYALFCFLTKVLLAHDHTMNPADYKMVGTVATVSSAIRRGGTGEIKWTQAGARAYSAARSDDGTPIAKGVEVVVTRYEKGIAYVCRWDTFAEKEKL
jgi:membrane protein implicated in regulation of membrane protease activity